MPARVAITTPDGYERELVSKGPFTAPAGSLIALRAPGSGGYGAPAERDREALARDVVDGYVSAESAARDYRVDDPSSLGCPLCNGADGGAPRSA